MSKLAAITIIGKSNEPLYFYNIDGIPAESLNLQMISYGALDSIGERRKKYVFDFLYEFKFLDHLM